MTTYAHLPSPLGELLVTMADGALTGLYFPEHRRGPRVEPSWRKDPGAFGALAAELAALLAGQRTGLDVPLRPQGTAFQQTVWQALSAIPYAGTTTYGALAAAVGRPSAVRAVAGAVARNPVSIAIPCHRVVGAGGAITGYAGGLARKRWLLELEAATLRGGQEPQPRG